MNPPERLLPKCYICEDVGWVCEEHPNKRHEHKILKGFIFVKAVECGGAGMPCECNKDNLHRNLRREEG